MTDNTVNKTTMKNPFADKVFTVCFVAMLMIVLFGRKVMNGLADIFGLGPGWPELLQGVMESTGSGLEELKMGDIL